MIHPTAVIHPKANLAEDITIGPFVVIEANVSIGQGSTIMANSILHSGCRIGRRCTIGPYAVLANTPMDHSFAGEESYLDIEDEVTIKEYVSLHRASGDQQSTRIGEGSLLMPYVHAGHNVNIGKHCIITNSTQVGGHATIGNHCVLSSQVMVHQFCRIGDYAMAGGLAGITKDILPFTMVTNLPAKHIRINKVGLERNGITGERYRMIEQALRAFRKNDLERIKDLAQGSADVRKMLAHKEQSRRGIAGFTTKRDYNNLYEDEA